MEADSSVYMSMYVTYAEIEHVHGRWKRGGRGSLSCLIFPWKVIIKPYIMAGRT